MYKSIVSYIKELFGNQETVVLHEPRLIGNEKRYLEACIDSTFVSSVGEFVNRFERMVTDFTGAKSAVACVNGTNGLHLAMMIVGVERGDEVITQPLTFIATCNAISYIDAHPVFIDVDLDTMGLSPEKLHTWLKHHSQIVNGECFNRNSGRRIKACVPMHTFGHPVRIDQIATICSDFHVEVVEDAAESIGSLYKGRHTGTFTKIGVTSFNGNKTITTGGGGMLLFNDETLAKHAKHLTTQAKVPHSWEFVHDEIGYNYRMPNLNAALGCAQMENIELFLSRKRVLAELYADFFSKTDIRFFHEPPDCHSNYWLNAIIFKSLDERDAFLQFSNANGVMTRPIWRLMNKLPMFEKCECADICNAEWLADRVVNIPSSVRS